MNYNTLSHAQQVKERLPGWLAHLKPAQLEQLRHLDELDNYSWLHRLPAAQQEELHRAQARCRASVFALARALDGLLSAPAFAEPLLKKRLHEAFGIDGELHRLKLARFSRDWNWMLLQTDLNHRVEPLLQAALQNFEANPVVQPESVLLDGDFGVSSFNGYPRYHFTPQPLSAAQFATLCHELDLGQRYQDHLDEQLGRDEVRQCAVDARRAQFCLDRLIAQGHGLVDDGRVLRALCDEPLSGDIPALACHGISLFGITLHDALLIGPTPGQSAVFLYLPGMPDGALRRYETAAACRAALIQRLCQPAPRRHLLGCIQHDQREHFAGVLQRNLTGQRGPNGWQAAWQPLPSADLHWKLTLVPAEPFHYQQDAHHQRLLAEARLVAVPSRAADEAARRRRLRYWESLGLDALSVAAFFLPAAGQVMMLVFASQVLSEVYEGVEAWRQGDIDTALDHLKAVALDVGMAAGTGIATHYAAGLGSRLVEGVLPNGTPRLWNGDLSPWRAELPASAEVAGPGLLRAGEQHYVALDASPYQVEAHADGQRWQIVHPTRPEALRPVLEHNGHGTWHGAHEQPLQWSRRTLLQRLGEPVADYDADELEIASHVGGVRRDELLDVYLKQRPVPPRLLATLQRLRTDEASSDPLEHLIEGLFRPRHMTPDSERLALLNLVQQPGWPSDCALELRSGEHTSPVQARAGKRSASDVRLLVKIAGGYRAVLDDRLPPLRADLFDALLDAVPELGNDPFTLKSAIAQQAQQRPELTLSQVWSGHSETWSDAGRLLGGYDQPPPAHYPPAHVPQDPLVARYRRLFPTASDHQAMTRLGEWDNARQPAHVQLRALEQQLDYLRTVLGQWAEQRLGRCRVRDQLIASWQHNLPLHGVLDIAGSGLIDTDFGTFPHLAGAFGHIEELHLASNTLLTVPELLIRQLPGLHTLQASSINLSHFPAGLGAHMRVLELSDNRIVWSATSQAALASYPHLEFLDLSGNPLVTAPDLAAVPVLRSINLFDTNLIQIPTGLEHLQQLECINLASNQIVTLPPLSLPRLTQQALALEYNPLDAASVARIEEHYRHYGIDLMVSEDDYTSLMLGADADTWACWERLSRKLPVQYRRDLRDLADKPAYAVAPNTTRRRVWNLLRWLDSSEQAMAVAIREDASRLLLFEVFADLQPAYGFTDARDKTVHFLHIAVMATRYQAIGEALRIKVPFLSNLQFESLRALALQRISRDPRLQLYQAPLADEPVHLIEALHLAPLLDAQWVSSVQARLLDLNGTTQIGRDALLVESTGGDPLLAFWVKRLEERYASAFDDLQDYANRQLEDAEVRLNEGQYLIEANRLRQHLAQERRNLLDRLTRQIAEGTQTDW